MHLEEVLLLLFVIMLGANCCSLASLWYLLNVNRNGDLFAVFSSTLVTQL